MGLRELRGGWGEGRDTWSINAAERSSHGCEREAPRIVFVSCGTL